jgi:hypothetical protein
MPTRTAQIVINIDDQAVVRLNQELKDLQDTANSLSGTKTINTSTIEKSTQSFKNIVEETGKVEDNLKNLGGSGLGSVGKVAKDMAGGFEKGAEAIATTGKAVKGVADEGAKMGDIMRGLSHLMRIFGSEGKLNAYEVSAGVKGIGDVAKGLIPLIGEALAPALIAAAVAGLIVVAIKWKDITRAVGEYIEKRKLTKELEREQEEVKAFEKVNTALDKGNKILEDRRKFLTVGEKNDPAVVAGYEADVFVQFSKQNEEIKKQIELRKTQLALNSLQFDKAQRAVEKISGWGGIIAKQDTEKYKKAEALLKTTQLEGDALQQEKENLEKQLILNEKFLNERKDYAALHSDDAANAHQATENAKNQLTILQAQGNQEDEIYNNKKRILEEEQKSIAINSDNLTKLDQDERDRLDAIKAEVEALTIQHNYFVEERRIKEQLKKDDIERVKFLRDYNRELDNQKLYYSVALDSLKEQQQVLQNQTKFFTDQIDQLEQEQNIYKKIYDARQAVVNFDKIGLENEKEATRTLTERVAKNEEGAKIVQDSLEIEVQNRKAILGIGEKLYQQNVKNASEELFYYTKIKEASNEKLENDKKILEIKKQTLVVNKQEVDDQIKKNENLQIEVQRQLDIANAELSKIQPGKHFDEERKAATQKVIDLETQLRKMDQENIDNKAKSVEYSNQIVATDNEILGVDQEIYKNTQGITDETEKTNAALKEQARLYSKLQNFVKKYGEEIAAVQEVISKSFEALAAFQDRKAEIASQRIETANKELDDLKQKESDNQDLLKGYEEELKDANGDRYDELLKKIDEAKTADIQAKDEVATKQAQIDELARQQREAEYKAAKWRKAQAIVEGVINTALAVIKALPNVFLSVAAGIAGAASVAVIASQKLPPKDFAVGGFTGFGDEKEPAGTVHKNEYVVPAYVVRNPQSKYHLQALESKRKGYANGGMVSPNISNYSSQFDYDKLISGLASAISELPPPQVGLVNIYDGINKVQLTKTQAGLTR